MDTRYLVCVDVLLADLPPSFNEGLVEDPDTKDAPNDIFLGTTAVRTIVHRCCQLLNFSAVSFG